MLTTTKINALKPKKGKNYKVFDANGLYIDVRTTGTKVWRQKYRYNKKEGLLTHGKYPMVSLKEARELRDKAIRNIHDKLDPARIKRREKNQAENAFGVIAKEWHEKQAVNWKPIHATKVWRQFEADILPYLKDEPIDNISPTDLLEVLKRIEDRGALDIAARQRQRCDAIFKHAILTERATLNPATQLVGVLKTKKVEHRKALDRKELPEFLKKLESTEANSIVKIATKMIVHTFVRTGELRGAKWSEFDMDERLWLIPANRMKMDADHLVPLSDQAIALLTELHSINGNQEHVFASPQRRNQPISNNAVLNLLYRMGYKGRATGHGFRATASTALNELGYNSDAIERQLSHTEQNKVKAAYNRSEYIEERKKLMQDWSNIIESDTNKVIPIRALANN